MKKKDYFIDPFLKQRLDIILKKRIKKKFDYVLLVDGYEGNGKSTLADSISYYLDNSFSLDNVVFTPEQFMQAADTLPPESVILWDEATLGALNTDFMSRMQKTIIKVLTTKRSKRFKIIILVGDIWLLNRWIAQRRSHHLIHVYSFKGYVRGYYKFYNFDSKNYLYDVGRESRRWDVTNPDFLGRFQKDIAKENNLFYDNEEYEKKKNAAISELINSTGSNDLWKERTKELIKSLNEQGLSQKKIGKLIGMQQTHVSRLLNED